MSMLTTEWNWDTAKEVWQEEAREEGRGEILKLFEQGLSVEEIKERLKKIGVVVWNLSDGFTMG
jgi:hypothetical protein